MILNGRATVRLYFGTLTAAKFVRKRKLSGDKGELLRPAESFESVFKPRGSGTIRAGKRTFKAAGRPRRCVFCSACGYAGLMLGKTAGQIGAYADIKTAVSASENIGIPYHCDPPPFYLK